MAYLASRPEIARASASARLYDSVLKQEALRARGPVLVYMMLYYIIVYYDVTRVTLILIVMIVMFIITIVDVHSGRNLFPASGLGAPRARLSRWPLWNGVAFARRDIR